MAQFSQQEQRLDVSVNNAGVRYPVTRTVEGVESMLPTC